MITSYPDALAYITAHTPDPSRVFEDQKGLDRMAYLLQLLGNPQDNLKSIHIAGTSGKGSTAYITSAILSAHGFRVGLHVSPHLHDIRERMMLNTRYISEERFVRLLGSVIPVIDRTERSRYGKPTYFEILVAMAFTLFAEEAVDYAVLETGLGGTYDGTNTIHRNDKVAIITKIGLDHTEILGHSLPEIAKHKAGIIGPGNTVITLPQAPDVRAVLEHRTGAVHGTLVCVGSESISNISVTAENISFDFSFNDLQVPGITLPTPAIYQTENASLALATIYSLSSRDGFALDERTIRTALTTMAIPGRMEVRRNGKSSVILDGAHNPQKIRALADSLRQAYPGRKFRVLLAVKNDKNFTEMLELLKPLTSSLTVTGFAVGEDLLRRSAPAMVVREAAERQGFKSVLEGSDPVESLHSLIKSGEDVLVTGSLYLLSTIYPKLDIILPKNDAFST